MTPLQHYNEAEALLRIVRDTSPGTDCSKLLARAQVHATLATRLSPIGGEQDGGREAEH